jgi:hypothetical protein
MRRMQLIYTNLVNCENIGNSKYILMSVQQSIEFFKVKTVKFQK